MLNPNLRRQVVSMRSKGFKLASIRKMLSLTNDELAGALGLRGDIAALIEREARSGKRIETLRSEVEERAIADLLADENASEELKDALIAEGVAEVRAMWEKDGYHRQTCRNPVEQMAWEIQCYQTKTKGRTDVYLNRPTID